MCGLTGFVGRRRDPRAAREMLSAMTEEIIHRGPDSTGFHVDEGVAFAFTRLAINDLAGGRQPMYDESQKIVAMTTGEIYNYHELRDLLTQCHLAKVDHDAYLGKCACWLRDRGSWSRLAACPRIV